MTLIDARQHVTQPNGWTDCNPIGHAIHHTVTMMLSPNATMQDEIKQIEAIDAYHVFMEYGGFGYHTITFPSGRSYLTGNWRRARAHVMYRNHELVGSVAAGDFSNTPANGTIIAGLGECVRTAREVFGRTLEIRGHGQWADPRAPSSCPGQIRNQIGAIEIAASVEEDEMTPEEKQQLDRATADIAAVRKHLDALTGDFQGHAATEPLQQAHLNELTGQFQAHTAQTHSDGPTPDELAELDKRLDAIAKAAAGDG